MDLDMGGDDAPMELDADGEEEPEGDEEEMLQEALRGISYVPSQKKLLNLLQNELLKDFKKQNVLKLD